MPHTNVNLSHGYLNNLMLTKSPVIPEMLIALSRVHNTCHNGVHYVLLVLLCEAFHIKCGALSRKYTHTPDGTCRANKPIKSITDMLQPLIIEVIIY